MSKPKLIIVTGISGSGKTTLCDKIRHIPALNVVILPMDDYKINVYNVYGFDNEFERQCLKNIAKEKMLYDACRYLLQGMNVVVEYAFTKEWEQSFLAIKAETGCELVICNCGLKLQYSEIWERKIARDLSDKGDPALYASVYHKDGLIIRDEKRTSEVRRMIRESEFTRMVYNCLHGDVYLEDEDVLKYAEKECKIKFW